MPKDETDGTPAEQESMAFVDVLERLNEHMTLAELDAHLQNVVCHVRATGKKGTITFKLTLEPVPKSDSSVIVIRDEITVKLPAPDRTAEPFFSDQAGGLAANPHKQSTINYDAPRLVTRGDDEETDEEADADAATA